jgi:hypothetical protein
MKVEIEIPEKKTCRFSDSGLDCKFVYDRVNCMLAVAYLRKRCEETHIYRNHTGFIFNKCRWCLETFPTKKDGRLGDNGLRDPEHPCELFLAGKPDQNGTCCGDGHYLCLECEEYHPDDEE